MENYNEKIDLKDIISKTLSSIESSKDAVFNIVDHVKNELDEIKIKLNKVKKETTVAILEVDEYRQKDQLARNRLVKVSKNLKSYGEADIKKAYEIASLISMTYQEKKFNEKLLIEKRSELERNLISLRKVLENGETLITKINVAFDYLSQNSLEKLIDGEMSKEDRINIAIKMLEAREQEKKRISREIHDGPAQSIASIVFQAEICSNVMKKDMNKGLEEIENLKSNVRETLNEVRAIIYDLRPMSIDDIGFLPTIRKMIEIFERKEGIHIEFKSNNIVNELDKFIELTLFRIIQEILNNVKKHSQAKNAKVELEFGMVYLKLQVKDDGIGFNIKETLKRVKNESTNYGLIGVINRVKEIMGEINIESSKKNGTYYDIKIPINKGVILSEL
ncbi:histidine kinase [Clostridiaceae bacterium HSG29]|nr:histidine kinase [Clostridiaceae bacterium HSG29]